MCYAQNELQNKSPLKKCFKIKNNSPTPITCCFFQSSSCDPVTPSPSLWKGKCRGTASTCLVQFPPPWRAHIKSAISKTRKGIGLLKYLSKYLPRHTLNELYKLYVGPHLDYGDVIYHIPEKVCDFSQYIILPDLMEKLESVQYSAALAVSGAWRGTSREKLYTELG